MKLKNGTIDQNKCFNALYNFILQDKRIKKAYLFGSCARGDNTIESDLDILLVPSKNNIKSYHQIKSDLWDISASYSTEVDIVIKTHFDMDSCFDFNITKEMIKIKEN